MSLFSDFIDLIYPRPCAACYAPLYSSENSICTLCKYKLPQTGFCTEPDNPVFKTFWGRANIKAATAYYLFQKGSKVQRLVHQLKYKGRKDVGIEVGRVMGIELSHAAGFNKINTIVPVPLHRTRQNQRGYNQAEVLSQGISLGYQNAQNKKPSLVCNNILYRSAKTFTQTKKGRFARWENMTGVFKINPKFNTRSLIHNQILLVDDVITTGSTLDACANTLLQIPNITVSIAAMAYACK